MVGFSGGEVLKNNLADTIVHVKSDNYGIVEDAHQIIMHSLAQSIRIKNCKSNHKLKL
jgi:D-sedoheptulose 7-phosphate isomerase